MPSPIFHKSNLECYRSGNDANICFFYNLLIVIVQGTLLSQLWELFTSLGSRTSSIQFQFLTFSRLPDIPGLEEFSGESFHTSEWKKDFVPKGKRIAVIGTGASAVQVVPALAEHQPASLTVFQRWGLNDIEKLRSKYSEDTCVVFYQIFKGYLCGFLANIQRSPVWNLPRGDFVYSSLARTVFAQLPLAGRIYRQLIISQDATDPIPAMQKQGIGNTLASK